VYNNLSSSRIWLLFALVCALLAGQGGVLPGWGVPFASATTTSLTFVPASVSLDIGGEAWVSILINEVTDLYGADVRLAFNPAIIEILDAIPGDPISLQLGDMPYPDFVMKNQADNTNGTIWYAVAQLYPREPASGSGFLAHIHLRAKNEGTTELTFTSHDLVTRDGLPIPHSVGSCTIRVGPHEATATATGMPTKVVTPLPTPTTGATHTATAPPTITPSPAMTPIPTGTPTMTRTPEASHTPLFTPTPTRSPTVTATPQPWVTASPTATPSYTPLRSPTLGSTSTATPPETLPSPSATPTSPSGGQVYVGLRASRDTYITGEFPNQNFGSLGALELSLLRDGPFKNALVGFDLQVIPPSAVLIEAKLFLFGRNVFGEGRIPLWAYGLRRDWDELRATWYGASADETWEQSGALGPSDHDDVGVQGSFVDGPQIDYYEWDVRPLVQEWINGTRRNDGFLITPAGGAMTFIKLVLYSREYREFALTPFLSLVYILPTPTLTPTATGTPTLTATPTATVTPTELATLAPVRLLFLPVLFKAGR
jgi:hypothetical protein